MLDGIVEIMLEIVLKGAMGEADSGRVPRPVRALLAGMVLLFLLGTAALVLWTGVRRGSLPLTLTGLLLLACLVYLGAARARRSQRDGKTGK